MGSAELGLEAAAAAGVELSRTILVPDPGDAWLEVTAALIDVLGIVVVRPPAAGEREAMPPGWRPGCDSGGRSWSAWGDWPRCEARLGLSDVEWVGLGSGHGHLRARQATVEVQPGYGAADVDAGCGCPTPTCAIRPVETNQPAARLRSVS